MSAHRRMCGNLEENRMLVINGNALRCRGVVSHGGAKAVQRFAGTRNQLDAIVLAVAPLGDAHGGRVTIPKIESCTSFFGYRRCQRDFDARTLSPRCGIVGALASQMRG